MAKTTLFEAQSPAMEMRILRHTTPGSGAISIRRIPFASSQPFRLMGGGQRVHLRGGQAAYVTLDTSSARGIRDCLRGASPTVTECQ